MFADRYRVRLGKDFPAPGLAQGQVTAYDRNVRDNLPVTAPDGASAGDTVVFGRLRVGAREAAFEAPAVPLATFWRRRGLADQRLSPALAAGETVAVTFYWQALAPLGQDYTVFVHLVGPNGNTVAQADAPPANGAFPTDLWQAADQIVDVHELAVPADAPAGAYTLCVGFYRPDTGERLPATDGAGVACPRPDLHQRLSLP